MEPEVLILQVDKVLRVAQRVSIDLCNALDASMRVEAIGMLRNSTSHLHHGLTLQWKGRGMLVDEQIFLP